MSKRKIIIAITVAIIVLISGGVLVVSLTGGNSASKQVELGNKYLMEGKYEEAILAFEKAIKLDPKNVEARLGLARAYVAVDQLDKAEEVLKEAMEIDPMRPEPYIELAKIYINQGNIEEAVKILEQGYEKTKNEEIKKLLDEIKTGYETTEDAEQGQSKENND